MSATMDDEDGESRMFDEAYERVDDALNHLWDLHSMRFKLLGVDPTKHQSFTTLSMLEDVLEILKHDGDVDDFRSVVIDLLDRMVEQDAVPIPPTELPS